MVKKLVIGLLAVGVLFGVIVALLPSPVHPLAYHPPRKPELKGVLTPNTLLTKAELLGKGKINGPEDVAVDSQGRVYGGTRDGKIVRVLPNGAIETFADTQGRPLGMQFDAAGRLIVCDSYKGLLAIDPSGQISVLATEAGGVPFRFTDDLDIASDGTIYFSDASDTYTQPDYLFDLLEARPHGRLLSYNPATGKVTILLKDLYFANGVALSQNEDFVLVNETYRYRIQRYWLKGPKVGTSDIFIDNLPGFPDNISANRRGTFWLALFTVRNDMMDAIHPFPFVKRLLAKMPRSLWPKPEPYGFVLALDEQGRITRSLQEPSGKHLKEITSAKEYDGFLYLGSLHNDRIGKYPLP
ncbi:MAG: SMP-30/gluconolactonase/LRE family protein [Desulfobacteraceae bacterium]|nr:SMP-30/gluconolactonase/LRE family protein [Desulfobacteraceae bacterium]